MNSTKKSVYVYGEKMKNLFWKKYTSIEQNINDIDVEEPLSPAMCLLCVVGILMVGVLGFILIVVGLSF